jgi:hypothetical protein
MWPGAAQPFFWYYAADDPLLASTGSLRASGRMSQTWLENGRGGVIPVTRAPSNQDSIDEFSLLTASRGDMPSPVHPGRSGAVAIHV